MNDRIPRITMTTKTKRMIPITKKKDTMPAPCL